MVHAGFYVTGTDTDVGKTRVCAALTAALKSAGFAPMIVKLVQTGVAPQTEGDAALAGRLGGSAWFELARFSAPADPCSAALAEGCTPLSVDALVARLPFAEGPLIVEGSGGAAVPLNASESLSDVAARVGLSAVIAVGVRLGCINHAILTIEYLRARGIAIAGIVLVERWQVSERGVRADLYRTLHPCARVLGTIAFDEDASRSTSRAQALFAPISGELVSCTTQS